MEPQRTYWRLCSSCKRELAFESAYFTCSVSTCNRKGTDFAFCSVDCWDAHVPTYRHRDAWADEKTSPTADEWAREQRTAEPVRRVVTPPSPSLPRPVRDVPNATEPDDDEDDAGRAASGAVPRDILVVVSKIKAYVKITSGMNTSDDVVDPLSDRLRIWLDDAIDRARADGRKTVMARDFRRQG